MQNTKRNLDLAMRWLQGSTANRFRGPAWAVAPGQGGTLFPAGLNAGPRRQPST